MTALTTAVTDILTSCSTLLTSLFSGSGETVNALNVVAGLPIVSGVIAVVVAATRKGRG